VREHAFGVGLGAARDGMRDGAAKGKTGSDQECHDDSVAQLQRCGDFRCGIYSRAFAAACLSNASERDGLCDSVPRDPGVVESVRWVTSECARIGGDQSVCQGIQQAVLEYCTDDGH
jgi:hypothetical protein